MNIQDLQGLWWLFVVVIGGTLVFVFRIGWKAKAQAQRIDTLEKSDKQQREDVSQIIMAQFAVLDGLKQLNCNGSVTAAHRNLQNYLAQRK
jgi:cell division protein FtsW (lipid II flippase)